MRFKLVSVSRPHIIADEIILAKDELGNVIHSISAHEPREIPEELLGDAHTLATRAGYRVVEVPENEEEATSKSDGGESASDEPVEENQPVGDDVKGMSPTNVGSGGGQPGAGEDKPSTAAPAGTPTSGFGGASAPPSTTTTP